ncbi:hypothetical protein [Haloferula sp.]|uniref:hypothetical protein n=1 Tax=Haloferula sp. TaxID=2497595 RepID=UPI00329C31B2
MNYPSNSFEAELEANGDFVLKWHQVRGMFYTVHSSNSLSAFAPFLGPTRAESDLGEYVLPADEITGAQFYRVTRTDGP